MKKVAGIIVIVVLLAACGWFFFTNLMWRIPAQPETHAIELADLDGDGDLDAFLANGRNEAPEANTVLWNNGRGNFKDSQQRLGDFESRALALADFDSDGDIDSLVSNIAWGEYFWNDGSGKFQQDQSVMMPDNKGFHVGIWRFEPADLNGDNQVDLFLTGCCGGGFTESDGEWQTLNASNAIWLSDGGDYLEKGDQQFGIGNSEAVALADLDGDGDLDAFVANSDHLDDKGDRVDFDANEVWLNDGSGAFTDSGQRLGNQRSYSAAVGDLDGDGDLDALVGNRGPDEVWWNDGRGHFSKGELAMGDTLTRYSYLVDLDEDGDLDAFLGSDKQGRIWLNDGRGHFTDSGQRLNYSRRHAPAIGDVNNDGATDVVAGKLTTAVVWFNDGAGQLHQ